MVANFRLLAPLTRRQQTQFVTIKSPIHAVKFSTTIQLSPKSYNEETHLIVFYMIRELTLWGKYLLEFVILKVLLIINTRMEETNICMFKFKIHVINITFRMKQTT